MNENRIVIVGAGVSGLSTAWQLAQRGCTDVTVIEREYVATGSSAVSAGIVTRQYTNDFEIALRVEAYRALEQLEREHGLVFRRNGFLRLARDEVTYAQFVEGAALQRELGVPDAVAPTRDELSRLVPDMRCDDLVGGLFSPSDGYLDGQQLTVLYGELAQALGVKIVVRAGLTAARRADDGTHVLATTAGEFSCDIVVNAAGAWAPRVGQMLGTPVAVVPERHQACIMRLDRPLDYELTAIMDYVPGSGEVGLYLRPEGEQQLLVGTHTNDIVEHSADPDDFYRGADGTFIDELIPLLVDRMPGLSEVGLEGGWAGLYPMGFDGEFIIGPAAEDGSIISAAGVGGVGVYMSPVVGRIAADWVLGADVSGDEHRRFHPSRPRVTSGLPADPIGS